MIHYFNCNYSLDILNGKSKMLRTGSVVREGQTFGAAFFENISVSGECKFIVTEIWLAAFFRTHPVCPRNNNLIGGDSRNSEGSIRHCKFKTMTTDIVEALYLPFR
jgi:hypothetical protein